MMSRLILSALLFAVSSIQGQDMDDASIVVSESAIRNSFSFLISSLTGAVKVLVAEV